MPNLRRMLLATLLTSSLAPPTLAANAYPKLRDTHDPELQAAFDTILDRNPEWEDRLPTASVVVSDLTDPMKPLTAWYQPDKMMYAASLPKIGIILGAFVEIDAGRMELDAETRQQLIDTVKVSSNRAATAVLDKVGIARLAEILQDPAHGKLYDPAYGGGLWVGKAFDKRPAWKRDPINHISHGASAMSAARFYYGATNGTLIDPKHTPLLGEIFGTPRLQHKFVKGLRGRNREIFRKSGTWRTTHADSAIVVHPDGDVYLVVVVGEGSPAGGGKALEEFIRQLDDMMEGRFKERAAR